MSEPAWDEMMKQSRLEEMYKVFRSRPEATDKEVALRLARFAEACALSASRRHVVDLDGEIKALNTAITRLLAVTRLEPSTIARAASDYVQAKEHGDYGGVEG